MGALLERLQRAISRVVVIVVVSFLLVIKKNKIVDLNLMTLVTSSAPFALAFEMPRINMYANEF
jgi:hypothetical protein